ncbi:bifunctional diaminohydroxyphosphoribosylaminopyrimidine deaminase/5-amino-6-(5-phosphoribosylamino)uracil reductase RibD [Vibrio sp. Of14-4]|uniref:bifunctional diaminohydroxyphosphoribosylaminopyrimidine deaminase/5-amino-6-(5-phosphoribosylamino)uracil reductase RibD n=1 Tax=Vibrio sp. Of14-4 TaxID=2724878 RepID=UPI001EF39FC3|nr:bifunctional diaminohydroxyphosphoribosylaminopyrimidine deaminase/5-amino-6-(5-phosphoribosylamino)uracil reductase RibD [Vibrio sp. Of14-4]MCG7488653.1 bifunctional diaminohydroxyphosphoribosylaminopyrimidine deaminase/5-amino-6-(5-phosphoribosylamino)uracil reductase RibD [Vibrio sp. Of14-4]
MSEFSSLDYKMMSRAINLAKGGIYTTPPNPNVGCVITRDDAIVGEGFHYRAGEPHAEANALNMAGEKAVGSTVYVTLEPCSHYGRTPPCASALIQARVAKVICAMEDPNPKVEGIKMLRDAGIEVQVGLLKSDAEALNPAFIKRMQTGLPLVQLKMAASIDGQTALSNGESKWITSAQARSDVQRYRAQSDAILSTSKTVVEDNASLNVRWSELPESVKSQLAENEVRQPKRVILDRQNLLTPELKLFSTEGPRIIVSQQGDLSPHLTPSGQIDLVPTFADLASNFGINHLWVEAGATLATSLIKQGIVDELVLYLSPKIMGSDGKGLLGALGLQSMQETIELNLRDVRQIGHDIRIIAKVENKES